MTQAVELSLELTQGRFDRSQRDRTKRYSRLDAFLHGGDSVMDFVMLGRASQVPAVLGKHALKLKSEDLGHFKHECERVAALVKFMDRVTDPKLVWEAEVYRPMLIDWE